MAYEAIIGAVLGLLSEVTKESEPLPGMQKPQASGAGFSHQPSAMMQAGQGSSQLGPRMSDFWNVPTGGGSPATPQGGGLVPPAGAAPKSAAPKPGAPGQDAGGDSMTQTLGNIQQAAQIGQAVSGMMGLNQQPQMPSLPPMPGAAGGGGFQYTPSTMRLRDIYG